MTAAFTIAGFLMGFMAARVSIAEPAWAVLVLPALIAFGCGIALSAEGERK